MALGGYWDLQVPTSMCWSLWTGDHYSMTAGSPVLCWEGAYVIHLNKFTTTTMWLNNDSITMQMLKEILPFICLHTTEIYCDSLHTLSCTPWGWADLCSLVLYQSVDVIVAGRTLHCFGLVSNRTTWLHNHSFYTIRGKCLSSIHSWGTLPSGLKQCHGH